DLSTLLGPPGLAYMPRDLNLTYNGLPGWDISAHSLSYQTLVGAIPQYRIEPQINAHWSQDNWNSANLDFISQYTSFLSPGPNVMPGNVTVNGITYNSNYQSVASGTRTVLNPTVTLPWRNSFSFLTVKTGVNFTEYDMGEFNTAPNNHYTRTLPITSVDTGLLFDRQTSLFDKSVTQTLEPRLYYVYIPYRDQSQLPVFDTALADFNRSTIFTENQYDGIDRINNANQVTAAVTSRILDPNSGVEIINAMLGQRFYFTPNAVLLPGQLPAPAQASDVLISLAASITQRWKFDSYFNFDAHDLHTQQMMASTTYTPAPGKLFNLSYRIDTPIPGVPTILTTATTTSTFVPGVSTPINILTAVKQWDVSSEWPLSAQTSFLGRVSYSTLDNQVMEGLLGVEYNQGCWVLRVITTRFAVTSVQSASAFYVQLELGGMGLGQNPMQALRRNIPGYMKTNEIIP
ncbi:MAG: LPS-assembly protein LptD, partial [Burkholderiales bacterium]